jgi:hypothetical protein
MVLVIDSAAGTASQLSPLLQRVGIFVNVAGRLKPAASRQEGPISEMSYRPAGMTAVLVRQGA